MASRLRSQLVSLLRKPVPHSDDWREVHRLIHTDVEGEQI